MHFTIDTDYAITAHDSVPPHREDAIGFGNHAELSRATINWLMPQFSELWNANAGVAPFGGQRLVKKFKNRSIAVKRIWQAIESGFRLPSFVSPEPEATIQSEPEPDMPK